MMLASDMGQDFRKPTSHDPKDQPALDAALLRLIDQRWIISNLPGEYSLSPALENYPQFLAEFLKWYVSDIALIQAFATNWWDAHIDRRIVTEVTRIQFGLTFEESETDQIIFVLRLSPSALRYALTPDPMIVQHHQITPELDDRVLKSDRRRFFRSIYRWLMVDFSQPWLAQYFGEHRKITKLENTMRFRFSNDEKVVLEETIGDVQMIGQLGEPYGGAWIQMLGIDDPADPQGNSPPPESATSE